jgi:hypothetical protein
MKTQKLHFSGTKLMFFVVLAIALIGTISGNAATITSTATGGTWTATTTWVGGVVPGTGDAVIIATTGTGSVDIAATLTQTSAGSVTVNNGATLTTSGGTITFGSLTINSGGTFTIYRVFTVLGATSISGTINFGSTSTTSRLMTFTGAVTLNSGAVWNETTTGVAATFSFGNNFTNNATTFTAQNTAHGFTGSGMILSGSTETSLPTVTFTGAYTNNGLLTVSTLLTVTGVTLTNNGVITASAALSGTGGVTQGTTGVLNIGGTSGITTLTATTAGNTVNYTGSSQTVKVVAYHDLTLSGTSQTFGAITTIGGDLTLSGTATATTAANLAIGGNLNIGNGTTLTIGGYTLSVTGTTNVGGGSSGTLAFTSVTNPNKTFTGLVTINSGAAWTESAAITPSFYNGIANSGTFTASSGVHTFSTNSQALTGTFSIPSVTVTGVTLTNNGTLTVTGALAGTGGNLAQATNSTLNLGFSGALGIATITANSTGNTVNYNYAGAQTVKAPASSYFNLNLSNSNTKTFAAALTIDGTLNIASGVVANLGTGLASTTGMLQFAGVGQMNGTWGYSGRTNNNTTYFANTTGYITVNSCAGVWTGATSTDWNVATNWCNGVVPTSTTDVSILSTATRQPTISSTAVCHNIYIGSSSTLTISGANSLTVSGNWTNNGTFTANSSTVTLNDAAQTIAGSSATTFYNLTVAGSGVKTLTTVPTVTGILSMEETGSVSVAPTYGSSATLQYNTVSSRTAGVEWITPFAATGGVVIDGTGIITANAAKVFNASVPLTVNSSASFDMSTYLLTLNGNLVNNGGSITGSGGVTITGTAAQNIGSFTNTGTVSMTKTSGTATLTGNVTAGAMTISGAGTLALGTGLTHTVSGTYTRSAGVVNGGSSTLRLGSSATITGGTFNAGTGTVEYYASGAQTVSTASYYNLIYSGSGAKTGAVTTVGGNMTLSGTATTTTSANLAIGGNLVIGDGTSFTVGAFTLSVTGTTTLGSGISGTLTFSSATNPAKTFTGLVTINPGATWTESAAITPTFSNGITNNGTFTSSTGVHTFSTNSQALNGTFSIPSMTVTGITLTNNGTLTVSTALAGTGGTLTQAANSTLNLGFTGAPGISVLSASNTGNTVNYNLAGLKRLKPRPHHTITLIYLQAEQRPSLPQLRFPEISILPVA